MHLLGAGVHAVCCGAPLAVHALGLTVAAGGIAAAHLWLHNLEWLVWLFSLSLLAAGGLLEWRARDQRSPYKPSLWLRISAACFLLNAGVLLTHQAA
jgi:hypothetical protein